MFHSSPIYQPNLFHVRSSQINYSYLASFYYHYFLLKWWKLVCAHCFPFWKLFSDICTCMVRCQSRIEIWTKVKRLKPVNSFTKKSMKKRKDRKLPVAKRKLTWRDSSSIWGTERARRLVHSSFGIAIKPQMQSHWPADSVLRTHSGAPWL